MDTVLKKEDFILYILNNLEPAKSDKFYVNKLAFLIEFAYLFTRKGEQQLSDLQYAAIDYGPVIDDYAKLFSKMESDGLIKMNGKNIRVVTDKKVDVPEEVASIALPLIRKYSSLSFNELSAITHQTDSYKITTQNEKVMGNLINKELAELETFYSNEVDESEEFKDNELPRVDRDNLVKYEFGAGV